MTIAKDVQYIGVNDHQVDLFEGQYRVPGGMAYNSYVILDEKIAVMDTVDARFGSEWLANLATALGGRQPDYLIVQHMEPDHSANILRFLAAYPNAMLAASAKAHAMMNQFFGADSLPEERLTLREGDTLTLGRRTLRFIAAPMVHWPEVVMTYDETDGLLFSADAFGKFGALDVDEPWTDEARRYYIGIVGKYGAQVQAVLKKAAGLDIRTICPLHGPVLRENLSHYLSLYQTWSSYTPESEGVLIAYTSVYGHTEEAVKRLAQQLRAQGCPQVVLHDLARADISQAVADAFRLSKLVLATTTYNADVFPPMRQFIEHLTARNYQKRTVALIENGSWAPLAAKVMREMLSGCRDVAFAEHTVTLRSALNAESEAQLDALATELCRDFAAMNSELANKQDMTALFKLGYGLYVVTSRENGRDNGLIVNAVSQLTDTPSRVAVTINKANYSHDVIRRTGQMNVNCLSVDAPFSVFERFGFQSGRDADKFAGSEPPRADNGLIFLPHHINAFLSLRVEQYVDLGTHGMLICGVTEARVINDRESMTYAYYHSHVKPKPQVEGKKGFVCKVCGYVYEGDSLPEDIVCPLCKHGAADFEAIT